MRRGDFILTWATASLGHPGYGSSIHGSPEEAEHMGHSACLTTVSPVDELNGASPKLHEGPHHRSLRKSLIDEDIGPHAIGRQTRRACTHGEVMPGHSKIATGGCAQPEGSLARSQPPSHLDLGLPDYRTGNGKFPPCVHTVVSGARLQ